MRVPVAILQSTRSESEGNQDDEHRVVDVDECSLIEKRVSALEYTMVTSKQAHYTANTLNR